MEHSLFNKHSTHTHSQICMHTCTAVYNETDSLSKKHSIHTHRYACIVQQSTMKQIHYPRNTLHTHSQICMHTCTAVYNETDSLLRKLYIHTHTHSQIGTHTLTERHTHTHTYTQSQFVHQSCPPASPFLLHPLPPPSFSRLKKHGPMYVSEKQCHTTSGTHLQHQWQQPFTSLSAR